MSAGTNDTTNEATRPGAGTAGGLWRVGLLAGALATVVNVLLLVIASAIGVDYAVRTQPGAPVMTVNVGFVLVATMLAMVVGLGLTHLARSRWAGAIRVMQVVGGVVAVVSVAMPLGAAEAATGARLTLAAMHLVTGAAFVAALGRLRHP